MNRTNYRCRGHLLDKLGAGSALVSSEGRPGHEMVGREIPHTFTDPALAGNCPAAGFASLTCRCPVLERVLFGVFEIVNFQVNVQLGPVQMIAVKQLDILYRAEHLLPEVRIVLVAEKILFTLHKEPDAERRYVLNAHGNGLATL